MLFSTDKFDGATDQAPRISQKNGESIWIDRMKDWDSSGMALVSYEQLQVEEDDGILRGYVDLTLNINGEEVVKEDVSLMFAESNGEWKLQDVEHLAILTFIQSIKRFFF